MQEINRPENIDDNYYVQDKLVLHGAYLYDYDNDRWQHSPDLYWDLCVNGIGMEIMSEAEAEQVVEKNGGKNFRDMKVWI